MTTPDEPWDIADRFVTAVSTADAALAASCCTPAAWAAAGDSPTRLYRDVTTRGMAIEADVAERSGTRATADVVVTHPSRPDQPRTVVLLLEETPSGWRIDGLSLGELHPAAFLDGALAARPVAIPGDPRPLGEHLDLASPAGRRLAAVFARAAEAGGTVAFAAARVLPTLARAELEVVVTHPGAPPATTWVYLDPDTGHVRAEASFPSWRVFLAAPADDDAPEIELTPFPTD